MEPVIAPPPSRTLTVGAGQLGPISMDESREHVVDRLIDLLHQAAVRDVELLAYPELALTTFFPRWWVEDRADADHWFETQMPGQATKRLFDEAAHLGIGFSLGYAELTPDGHHYNTQILVDRTGQVGDKYRLLGLPTTVFIDANGIIQSIYSGPLQSNQNNTDVQGAISQSDLEIRIGQIMAIATPTPGVSDGGG